MRYDPYLAERRFGYGHNAAIAAPAVVEGMIDLLQSRDVAQATYPLPDFRHLRTTLVARRRWRSYARKNPDSPEGKDAQKKADKIMRDIRAEHGQWFAQLQMRRITTQDGLRERLVAFWANHFTAMGKNGMLRLAAPLYIEEAIRPHVNGSFADMLIACVTHPLMLHYLDQNTSAGPNSPVVKRRTRLRGLNENLAREVLELHTLGVDGGYDQEDVRQLAKLFTGLGGTRDYGFKYRPAMAEPGAETVLGQTYSDKAQLETVKSALRDLARHPATAAHLSRKMVTHFVSDTPSDQLVQHVTAAYVKNAGALMPCYRAMLEHPDAWGLPARNIRLPDEFVSASLRALNVKPDVLGRLTQKEINQVFFGPLRNMGQPWLRPGGPDGFAEKDSAWVTPQGVAARLEWAMNAPARLTETLPDPRDFLRDALGEDVPPAVAFAAKNAATRAEAIGLILCAPAFQRR